MKNIFSKSKSLIFLAIILCLMCVSCSHSKSPVEISIQNQQELIQLSQETSNRSFLAAYDAVIDSTEKSFTVTPIDRGSQYHFPLSQYYPDVLEVTQYGFTPNFWADIKLTHPLPGSGIDVFDPRIIAVLPANSGVSFFYPIFSCLGNNSVILEPDGYTKLFDSLGGSIPGNTNPFKAYFKDQPYRVWSSTGVTSETQHWEMDLNGFGGPMQFKLVVDISTNYPNPPSPGIDNAPEPVQVEAIIDPGMTSSGGVARIGVTVLDWQGPGDIKCKVECPQLFNGAVQLFYEAPGPDPNEYVFSGTISNQLLAPEGDYNVLVAAWDIPSDPAIHIFHEAVSQVMDHIIFDPVDVTPPWLNLCPKGICIDGEYAYLTSNVQQLHVFDISEPDNPKWINVIDLPGRTGKVEVVNGYAYFSAYWNGFIIMDIDPVESAHIVKTVPMPGEGYGVHLDDGYAYVAGYETDFNIIDIDPPDSAYIAKTIETEGIQHCVTAENGYAYFLDNDNYYLRIVDVDPPESAYIAKSIYTGAWFFTMDMKVSDGYLYIGSTAGGLNVFDVDPVDNARHVATIPVSGERIDCIYLSGDYAFIGTGHYLCKINVENPEAPYVLDDRFYVLGEISDVQLSGDYAFVSDGNLLFSVWDIEPWETANIVKKNDSPGYAQDVYVSDGYAFVASFDCGFKIIDIAPLNSTRIIKSLSTYYTTREVYKSGEYAFVSDSEVGLYIFDVDPPETSYLVKVLSLYLIEDIYVSGGYAYVSLGENGLKIIDIDPPELAFTIKSIATPDSAAGVYVYDGYAYVAGASSGLLIIDIEPPESASIVKIVDTPGNALGVHVSEGYACVADYSSLQIIDVDPVTSAYIVKGVNLPISACDVYSSYGYSVVANYGYGLRIIDIDPPESAHVVKTMDTPGDAMDVYVSENYLYTADSSGGLRIIKLW